MLEVGAMFHNTYHRNVAEARYRCILDQHIRYAKLLFTTFQYLYYFLGYGATVAPFVICLVTDTRMLPYGFSLPYIDWATWPGFELNYVYVLSIDIQVVPGLAAGDAFFYGQTILAIGHLKLMHQMLNSVEMELQAHQVNNVKVDRLLIRICQEHRFHLEYITD